MLDLSLFLIACLLLSQAAKLHPGLVWVTTMPGLILHELAHFLTALVLFAHPESFSLVPEKNKDGSWTLGSVVFRPSWWNGAMVALAPLLLLPLSWLLYSEFVQHQDLTDRVGYLILLATFCWQAIPSRADWQIALQYPAPLVVIGGIAWVLLS